MSELKLIKASNSSIPLSRAVIHNGMVHVSGMVGFKPGTMEPITDDVAGQAREIFRLIDDLLEEAGTTRDRIVMNRVYLTDVKRDFAAMNEAYAQWLGEHRPARTTVGVALAIDGLRIEVDCCAALPG